MSAKPCRSCEGQRLKPEMLAVTIDGQNIAYVTDLVDRGSLAFFDELELNGEGTEIATSDLEGNQSAPRLSVNVGLDYLTLSRAAGTLVRRRSAAHPPGDADRIQPDGRSLYFGRAEHRTCISGITTG